ncbi:hypothetical protein NWP21_12380 [Anabaenopsis sp. FSS-46]|uniref:hypothetical protein n=1 Tax=Anabaenopsis sp. FSS-46 TaxID=2971766 RepID=UPI0024747FE5|nr:hypothetical protein [Anabaenopsis sp. FSS-46]MDH6099624.1 hypothetical protein [Anabaenopsis sp. FSS-46]
MSKKIIQDRIERVPVDNPDEREMIIVVSNFDRERLEYPEPGNKTFEKMQGVCFVRDDIEFYDQNSQEFLKVLKDQGLLRVGNILLQSKYGYQYPNEKYKELSNRLHQRFQRPYYLRAEALREHSIDRKYNCYLHVCTLLGAKKVSINIIDQKHSSSANRLGLNLLGNFPIKTSGDSSAQEIIEYYRSRTRKMAGSLPNIEEAERYVEGELLQEDEDISNLINARKLALRRYSEFTNPITEENFRLDLFSQVTTVLSLGVKIEFPQYLSSLNLNLNKYVKKIQKFTLDVKVSFPPSVGQ